MITLTCFQVSEYDLCITPDKESGICVPLKDCDNLYAIALESQTKTISDEEKLLLRKSVCTFGKDDKPWVCCAQSDTKVTTTTVAPSESKIYILKL